MRFERRGIYCRKRPGDEWRLWAIHLGTPKDRMVSAARLLDSMVHEEGLSHAAVRLGSHPRQITWGAKT